MNKSCLSSFKELVLTLFAELPSSLQRHILYDIAKIDQQVLDFNVRKNSTWTAYEITDETKIVERIPPDLELTSVKIFKNNLFESSKKVLFFNFFQVDSTYLSGNRLEIVTVVKDKKNGKKRFIIIDYYSDTISSDPEHCIKKPNATDMSFGYHDNLLGSYMDDKYLFIGEMGDSSLYELSKEFAVTCNKNIYYGSTEPHLPNYLEFDLEGISRVCKFKNYKVLNRLWTESISNEPFTTFYFPTPLNFKIQMDKLTNDDE